MLDCVQFQNSTCALLQDVRAANVRAMSDSLVLTCHRNDFQTHLGSLTDIRRLWRFEALRKVSNCCHPCCTQGIPHPGGNCTVLRCTADLAAFDDLRPCMQSAIEFTAVALKTWDHLQAEVAVSKANISCVIACSNGYARALPVSSCTPGCCSQPTGFCSCTTVLGPGQECQVS